MMSPLLGSRIVRVVRRPAVLPAAAAVASVALLMSSFGRGLLDIHPVGRTDRRELDELIAAVSTQGVRAAEGRLSGGFPYAPQPSPRRGEGDRQLAPAVRIAAAKIEILAREYDTPAHQALAGVASLVTGAADKAVAALQDAVDRDGANPYFQNDLSVAYVARATQTDRPDDWPKALAASERCIRLNPGIVEAWFNRALALQHLHVGAEARKAWREYYTREHDAAWVRAAHAYEDASVAPETTAASHVVAPGAAVIATRDATLSVGSPDRRQRLRETIEDELLPEWGDAWLRGDRHQASTLLTRAAATARTLSLAGGDAMAGVGIRTVASAVVAGSTPRIRALARAHVAYREARRLSVGADRHSDAADRMAKAAAWFRTAGSPYACWSPVFTAVSARADGRSDDALRALGDPLLRSCSAYRFLNGRVQWVRGLLYMRTGAFDAAAREYRAAADDFDGVGELEASAAVDTLLAENRQFLGQFTDAWAFQLKALRRLGQVTSNPRRHLIIATASFLALWQDMPEVAWHYQNALVSMDVAADDRAGLAEAYLLRATTEAKLHRLTEAAADLQQAEGALSVLDESGRARAEADIAAARTEIFGDRNYARALSAASQALTYYDRAGLVFQAVTSRVSRARLFRGNRDLAAASRDLTDAMALFESQRRRLSSAESRLTDFEAGWTAFEEMIGLEVEEFRRPFVALTVAELARGRVLLEGVARSVDARPDNPLVLRQQLPDDVVVLYYATLRDRVLLWTLTRSSATFSDQPIARGTLRSMVRRFRAVLVGSAIGSTVGDAAAPLYRLLVAPAQSVLRPGMTMVVIGDDPLDAIPFGALVQPSGRFVLEDHPVVMAPSLTFFVEASKRASARAAGPHTALVFAPTAARDDAQFPPLPDARAEATRIARVYATATLVQDADATSARFLADASRFDVIHFAGHGVANLRYPLLSRLLTYPGPDDTGGWGALTAEDIGRLRFDRTWLVVLGSCEGAAGTEAKGEGMLNLARPFLAAGVPAVVASFTPLADRPARELFQLLHLNVSAGMDPTDALRDAQIRMLHSSEPDYRMPSAWALVTMFGGDASRKSIAAERTGQ